MQKTRSNNIQKIIILGLLIALDVVLTRFLSIQLPFSRIGFGFLPIAVVGMLFGPFYGVLAGIAGDLIGISLFPTAPYFIGFTISAAIRGLIYGIFLRNRPLKFMQIAIASILVSTVVTICLDTTWLHIILGKGYLALLPIRLAQGATMLIIQVALISFVYESIIKRGKLETRIGA